MARAQRQQNQDVDDFELETADKSNAMEARESKNLHSFVIQAREWPGRRLNSLNWQLAWRFRGTTTPNPTFTAKTYAVFRTSAPEEAYVGGLSITGHVCNISRSLKLGNTEIGGHCGRRDQ